MLLRPGRLSADHALGIEVDPIVSDPAPVAA
jgi:hypothetical protein